MARGWGGEGSGSDGDGEKASSTCKYSVAIDLKTDFQLADFLKRCRNYLQTT